MPKKGKDLCVDQIVGKLCENQLTKRERMELLRELVQRQGEMPDEVLDQALQKLMDRLAD